MRTGTNRSKKEAEFRRFSEIERENYRLLDRMSKIMVRGPAESIFGVHKHANCPALDFEKARARRNNAVHEENKVLLKRIVNQQPYYSKKEFAEHARHMHQVISHKCKFENQVGGRCFAAGKSRGLELQGQLVMGATSHSSVPTLCESLSRAGNANECRVLGITLCMLLEAGVPAQSASKVGRGGGRERVDRSRGQSNGCGTEE